NSNVTAYTDFQVKVIVNTQALVSAGKMNNKGYDIRFTDSLCNVLSYTIDSNMNTTTTVIWVKVKNLPGSRVTTIYMYYGNGCATTVAENGDSTFLLFDHFNTGSLNTGKWTSFGAAPAFSSTNIKFSSTAGDAVIKSVSAFAGPYISEMKVNGFTGSWPNITQLNNGTNVGASTLPNGGNLWAGNSASGCASYLVSTAASTGIPLANGVWGMNFRGINDAIISLNASSFNYTGTLPTYSSPLQSAFGLLCAGTGTMSVDWFRARKYAPIQPVAANGTEAFNKTLFPTPDKTAYCPGDSMKVTFTKSNTIKFNTGNTFTYTLSDATGSFAAPVTIGSYSDTISKTIAYFIPKTAIASKRYKVRIVSTNPSYSCFTSDSFTINAKPVPSFIINKNNQCFHENKFTFTSTSTIPSGTIAKHNWDFGNRLHTTTLPNDTNRYNTYLTKYKVILTEESALGCKDTVSHLAYLKESPEAEFTMNKDIQCLKTNKFKFKSQSTVFVGTLSYRWFFGNGDSSLVADSVTYKYPAQGNYAVKLIVKSSASGCIDTIIHYNLINPDPKAIIGVKDTGLCFKNNKFKIYSNSTVSNGVPLYDYWTLGDGSRDSLTTDTIRHTYTGVKTYNIRLIIISDDGCRDTAKGKVTTYPMPVSNFLINNSTQCQKGNSFGFRAKSVVSSGTISNNWYFGDGSSTLNVDTTQHTYLTPNTFNIKLRSVTNKGCLDSITKSVTVNASPKASFTTNKKSQCAKGNVFKFKNTTTLASGTYTRMWQLGDGSPNATGDSVTYTYPTPGKYQVKLITLSNKNCADTAKDSATINVMPTPLITLTSNADQCLPGNSFKFTDNSTIPSGTIKNTKWVFGDGGIDSNKMTVNHTYKIANVYTAYLIANSNFNCFDTAKTTVTVYDKPEADFSINDTDQCLTGNLFRFTDMTYSGPLAHINEWIYGDGSPNGSGNTPVKTYSAQNTYTVTLITTSDIVFCKDTIRKTVIVFPQPKPSFTVDIPSQCLLGNKFRFDAGQSTIAYGSYTRSWKFGDNISDGDVDTTSHSFLVANTASGVNANYKVILTLVSDQGCSDTANRLVKVNPMPKADFIVNKYASCLAGNSFQFGDKSTIANSGSLKQNWDLGDGTTQNTSNFFHSYLTDSTFKVTLISSSLANCKDTISKDIVVYPMPLASFSVDDSDQCLNGNIFTYTNTSTIKSGSITQNDWNHGDNTTANTLNSSHSYITPNTFKVTLIVASNNLCKDTATAIVNTRAMPVADFTASPRQSCFDGHSIKTVNKSSISQGTITGYTWSWGDGIDSFNQNPQPYKYAAAGNYKIILKVTSDYGCEDTASDSVFVYPNPFIGFTVDSVCLKDSSLFVNTTTVTGGVISTLKWFFGDGKTSTVSDPHHYYRKAGSYDVWLTVVTDKGCKDTLKSPGAAKVNPNPKARFTFEKLRSFENETDIQFVDSSSKDAISWNWDFGNGNTSTDQNPLQYYTDTSTKVITLIVENGFGCRDTTAEATYIYPDVIYFMPSAFSPNNDNLNERFKPIGLAYAKDYKFLIFDRWGNIMFKTNNPKDSWDGMYMGELVPQDVYYYRLEFVGVDTYRRSEKGYIMILR
ncbi:MAG: DUF2341 domain-containing protein, partial [Bacteroidia bacterium]|nr:DUF2341 domain-containing protein [Bacteroidia bacterium]